MARILLGFMGAGKSTIASLLDPDFIDMDILLEQELGMAISDFFEIYGEKAFRQRESILLAQLLTRDGVISTGGGIVTSEKNRQLLKENSDNIYLKADFETLYHRIKSDKIHHRPLFLQRSKEDLNAIFQQRQVWYEEVATQVIDVSHRSPYEIVEVLR